MTEPSTAIALGAPALHQPHTLIFFVGALLCLFVTQIPGWSKWSIDRQRQVYWGATAGAAACAFLAGLPDWQSGVLFGLFVLFLMAMTAYLLGNYIKIGGRIYAFHLQDAKPDPTPVGSGADDPTASIDDGPDPYGGTVSAPKLWWLMVVGMGICSFNIGLHLTGTETERPWLWPFFVVAIVAIGAGIGVGDGAAGAGVARRQYVQFVVIAITTAGAFVVFYLVGYVIGRRRHSGQVGDPGRTSRHQRR
ncbi:MAG: hypothetical protein HYZ38_11795 [Mycobacterium sp.]|nr:hypothetical protein [Mycobacterium sp.]